MKLAQKLALNYFRAKLNMTAVFSKRRAAEQAFAIFCTPFRRANKPLPPVFAKAERHTVMVNDIPVKWFRWNKGAGQRILIVHGFESSARNFDRYISVLVKLGFEVVAFDAPAHGDSGGKRITLPLFVSSIAAVVGAAGIPDAAMAHSFGGICLMHYLENTPAARHCRVVLIAPATESRSAVDNLFQVLQLGPAVREAFETVTREKGYASYETYSIPRILQEQQPSLLWVHDEEDNITPFRDVQPVMAAQYPNIEFMITRGWGHRRIYKENNVQKKVVSFLTGLPIPTAKHGHE